MTPGCATHTWGDGEVTHQGWLSWSAAGSYSVAAKQGFQKIMRACKQAKKDCLDWLWVDTDCIDKTRSAELTEVINSIYAWYRDSTPCYLIQMPWVFRRKTTRCEDIVYCILGIFENHASTLRRRDKSLHQATRRDITVYQ